MDWIEARVKCDVESVWTTLRETVCSDIERWRELKGKTSAVPTVASEDRRLMVTLNKDVWVNVEKRADYIRLRYPDPSKPDGFTVLRFVPRLNAKGECRLWLEETELEFWEASRKVLEPVLFDW